MNTLYDKILSLLERFLLLFTAWYEGRLTEQAKTNLNTSQELQKAIDDKNTLKEQVKGMSKDEKVKIAVSDN